MPSAVPVSNPQSRKFASVICVDLDGTLIATDSLWESILSIALRRPVALFSVAAALGAGKIAFKQVVARNASVNAARFPYRPEVIEYLREQKAAGRTIVLVTAAHASVAQAVAAHLPDLFDDVFSTTDTCNLKGSNKGRFLADKYGAGGFTYAGNESADLDVWKHARAAIAVDAPGSVVSRIPVDIEKVFASSRNPLRTLAKAIRVHQWIKNLLVFVPLLTSRDLLNVTAWGKLALAAFALSLVASAQYLINDLIDLESDREHPHKRKRPLASGALSIPAGLLLFPLLLIAGAAAGYVVGGVLTVGLLASYFVSSLLYSKVLKTKPLIDVFTLAGLYVFRIVIGGFVSDHHVTVWLLNFSYLCFLSLGFLKRFIEVIQADTSGKAVGRRGYYAGDAMVLAAMGVGSCFASAVVLSLYVHSEAANKLYLRPVALWGLVPLGLMVQCWLWLSGSRGYIAEDPVRYVLTDRVVWVSALLGLCVYFAATGRIL